MFKSKISQLFVYFISLLSFGQQQQKELVTRYFNLSQLRYLPKTYTAGLKFANGLAAVRQDSLWGYIDKAGQQTIGFKYQEAGSFYAGYAAVKQANQWRIINQKGVFTAGPYVAITPLKVQNKPYFLVQNKESLVGVIHAKNKILLPQNYQAIKPIAITDKAVLFYAYRPDDAVAQKLASDSLKQVAVLVDVYNANFKRLITLNKKDKRLGQLPYRPSWLKDGRLTSNFPKTEKSLTPRATQKPNEQLLIDLEQAIMQHPAGKKDLKIGIASYGIPTNLDQIKPTVAFVNHVPEDMVSFIKQKFKATPIKDLAETNGYYIYYYLVTKDQQKGVYGLDGSLVIPTLYQDINANNNSGFVVSVPPASRGLFQFNGQPRIPIHKTYSGFSGFVNQRYIIHQSTTDRQGGYATYQILTNEKGERLTPAGQYYAIENIASAKQHINYHFFKVTSLKDHKFFAGIIDRNGKAVVPPMYKYVSFYDADHIAVLQHHEDDTKLSFFDFESQQILKTIQTKNYNDFLIGTATDGLLRILEQQE